MSESEVRPSNSCSINFKLFLPLTDKQGQLQNCYSHQFFFLFTNSAVHADRTFSAAVLHFLLSTRLRRLAAFFRLVLGAFIKSDLSKDALIMGTYSYLCMRQKNFLCSFTSRLIFWVWIPLKQMPQFCSNIFQSIVENVLVGTFQFFQELKCLDRDIAVSDF